MKKIYKPRGVCAQMMEIDIDDGIVTDISILGGCNGNLKGISSLVRGMKAEDVIERLRGIRCGMKNTSCPDQIAIAIQEAINDAQ